MALVRPYGVVVDGALEVGVEALFEEGRLVELRPHTGVPEPYVLSPAFVNAHSHLEYRGLQGRIEAPDYWGWIRELTQRKAKETPDEVRDACRLAALENRATGVAALGEHSDRPFAGEAMREAGLGGVIYQETITFFERDAPAEKRAEVARRAERNRACGLPVRPAPHAIFTVDPATLAQIGASGEPFSMHVAETDCENVLTRDGGGPIAELFRAHGFLPPVSGLRVVPTLAGLGLVRPGAQFAHACALDGSDIEMLAAARVAIAHCPRSNSRLGCPIAPVREMLDAGLLVGLGMDSAASGGPIDMFAEMRAALAASRERGRPVSAVEVWRMATSMGARTLGIGELPWIAIWVDGARTTEELIERGAPGLVSWAF